MGKQEDGSVTITCQKSNEECPILGGYGVFGMSADNLEEANDNEEKANSAADNQFFK